MKNVKTRYDLAVEKAREAIEEIRLAAYEQGYEDARRQLNAKDPAVSAQARRDEIVEQAKADVEKLSNYGAGVWRETGVFTKATCYVEFVVNRDKRTVVALVKGVRTGNVYVKGIAKAAPSDCFNVHIGKAIALRRALSLAVPDEYLNAPQPTEVRVGDIIGTPYGRGPYKLKKRHFNEIDLTYLNRCKIIDDSREEVGE